MYVSSLLILSENIWHKDLLMRYSMRLKLNLFAVWMVFSWLRVYMEVTPLFFLDVFTLVWFTPSFVFDMFFQGVCVGVCVLKWFRISQLFFSQCVNVLRFLCVCVCVCEWFEIYWYCFFY